MTLFERMASGEFNKTKPAAIANLANSANQAPKLAELAELALATPPIQKTKPLTTAQQIELRKLVELACEPHEREEMFACALPCGIDSLTTYRNIVADSQNLSGI